MNQEKQIKKGHGFVIWLFWTLATTIAMSIFMTINIILGDSYLLNGLCLFGLIIGLFQWPVIRWRIRHAFWWVILTAAGSFLPGLNNLFGSSPAVTIILLFLGVGVAQMFVLSKSIQRAWLWIIVTAIASIITTLASAIPLMIVLFDGSNDPVYWSFFGAFSGAVFGAMSGLGLILMSRSPIIQQQTGQVRKFLTPYNIFASLVGLILLVSPFLIIGQVFSLQNRIYCDILKPGMTRTDVIDQLSKINSSLVDGSIFTKQNKEQKTFEKIPYPEMLAPYAATVTSFSNIEVQNPLLVFPQPGLGFDKADQLVLESSVTRNNMMNYQIAKCPWTIQNTLDTLFK